MRVGYLMKIVLIVLSVEKRVEACLRVFFRVLRKIRYHKAFSISIKFSIVE